MFEESRWPISQPAMYEIMRELKRATRVSRELADVIRNTPVLWKRISPRTKRWLSKQDAINIQREEICDKELRVVRAKNVALAKLTIRERKLLGLHRENDG